MKTLLYCSQPSLKLSNPPPFQPKLKPHFHSKTLQTFKTYKPLQLVKAKGFSSSQPTTSTKNSTQKNNKNEDDEELPEIVFNRIIGRILAFVGIPMATGIALLLVFEVIKEKKWWDVPVWLPFLTTFLTFGASTVGIAYGTLSASLDAEKKGSVLGLEEAKKNWVEMWKEEDESNG